MGFSEGEQEAHGMTLLPCYNIKHRTFIMKLHVLVNLHIQLTTQNNSGLISVYNMRSCDCHKQNLSLP